VPRALGAETTFPRKRRSELSGNPFVGSLSTPSRDDIEAAYRKGSTFVATPGWVPVWGWHDFPASIFDL
jgi:hypothetical protein